MDKCKGLFRLCHSSDEFLFIWYFFGCHVLFYHSFGGGLGYNFLL